MPLLKVHTQLFVGLSHCIQGPLCCNPSLHRQTPTVILPSHLSLTLPPTALTLPPAFTLPPSALTLPPSPSHSHLLSHTPPSPSHSHLLPPTPTFSLTLPPALTLPPSPSLPLSPSHFHLLPHTPTLHNHTYTWKLHARNYLIRFSLARSLFVTCLDVTLVSIWMSTTPLQCGVNNTAPTWSQQHRSNMESTTPLQHGVNNTTPTWSQQHRSNIHRSNMESTTPSTAIPFPSFKNTVLHARKRSLVC